MLNPAEQAELTYRANRRKVVQSIWFGYGLGLIAFTCLICGTLITQRFDPTNSSPSDISKLFIIPITSVFISILSLTSSIATISKIRQISSLSRRHTIFYLFTVFATLISLSCTILELFLAFPTVSNLFNP